MERGKLAAGAVWLDDFEVRKAGSNAGPTVALTASQSGTAFRDVVTFTATAAPTTPVARVEFRLNGRLRSSQTDSPAAWDLDTTSLANGAYTLQVRAIDGDGAASTTILNFTVQNPGNTARPPRREAAATRTRYRMPTSRWTRSIPPRGRPRCVVSSSATPRGPP